MTIITLVHTATDTTVGEVCRVPDMQFATDWMAQPWNVSGQYNGYHMAAHEEGK